MRTHIINLNFQALALYTPYIQEFRIFSKNLIGNQNVNSKAISLNSSQIDR